MLWFSNVRASPPAFIGVRLTEKGGAPVLILLYPDGSQETEIFDHEDARSLTSYRSRFLPFYPDLTRLLADARWAFVSPSSCNLLQLSGFSVFSSGPHHPVP